MKPDALIFDMDGTLWDAVDMYAQSWTEVFKAKGIDRIMTRSDLQSLMGLEIKPLLENAIPEVPESERETFYLDVIKEYEVQLHKNLAVVYPGVVAGLQKLSQVYPLFILSNCEKGGIKLFLDYSKTENCITSYLEHGENYLPKQENMRLLKSKFKLENPFYIGDTDSDRKASEQAGVPFIFVTYGFGTTDKYAAAFENFESLTEYFLALPAID